MPPPLSFLKSTSPRAGACPASAATFEVARGQRSSIPSTSVIIPCHNARPYIAEAVRSVLHQADAGVECLVVDDGSTDGSIEVVEREFGPRVQVMRQSNQGASAARNRGLAAARGELVIWLDADDVLEPGSLSERRRAFSDQPDLEMLVGCNRIVFTSTESCEVWPACADDLLPGVLCRRPPHLNVLTFRRSALDRIGAFDLSLATAEDYDLWLRAWGQLRWRFLERILAWQFCGGHTSLTQRTGQVTNYLNAGRVLDKNRSLFRRVFGSEWPWRRAYARWATDFALIHLHRGERGAAVRRVFQAFRTVFGLTEGRAYKYLLEGLLPPPLYRSAARLARRM